MRFLVDENLLLPIVEALRREGHDVAWVRADAPGSTDEQVLARALAEGRVLVTADKDFGDLAFGAGLGAGSGVILLRLRGSIPTWAAALVAAAGERDDWTGVFAVVTEGGVRARPLPRGG